MRIALAALSTLLPGGDQAAVQQSRAAFATNPAIVVMVNALDHGVIGDGVTDDGPAIRSLFANATGKTILFPAGRTYLIATSVSPAVPTVGVYPAMDNAGFIISRQSNFHVLANGATFTTGAAIPLTVTALIERGRNWSWDGGTFVGNRSGLKPGEENAAFAIINNVGFRISGIKTTGFGGNGAAFVGDWNVSGTLANLRLDVVGICFDLAFSKQLSIRDVTAAGADTNGASGGRGQVGDKCYSEVNDAYYASYNFTGVQYRETDGVTIENLDARNFNTAVAVSAGKHYRFTNVELHDNPGTGARNIPGLGYYFFYTSDGPFKSAGSAVTDVTISGGHVYGNGTGFRGAGLLIEGPTAAGGEALSGFSVTGVAFQDNAGTGVAMKGRVANVRLTGNSYSGRDQKTSVSLAGLTR